MNPAHSFPLLIKPVSADCNLRCRYCFYLDHLRFYPAAAEHRMSDATLERLISGYMATDQAACTFIWQGGEPTLLGLEFFRRVTDLQRKYGRPGAVVANMLQTNATLITDELARHFAQYRFLIGVSLDGPPDVHDRYRRTLDGAGTHAEVSRGIERLRRHGVEFNILTLVTEANAGRAREIYRYFRDRGMLYHQYIPCVEFDAQGRLRPYSVGGEAWGRFLCELFDEWKARDTRRVSVRLFDSIIQKPALGRPADCHMDSGFLSGAHNYLPGGRRSELRRGMEAIAGETEYLTDAFGREAVAFIRKNKAWPFFLYLPFNAVHAPMEASEKYLKRVEGINGATRRTYAAMTVALDDAVGRVLETLRREGLEENTFIFFLSDNGGPTSQTTSSNAPLRGYKGQVYEGGIRVPFMVQWKDRLPAGKVFGEPVVSLDIAPTVLAAAGIAAKPEDKLDGVDLWPYLSGRKAGRPHDVLYWRFQAEQAVRSGDWKLVKVQRQGRWELYNLADDIGESKNLAEKMPEKVRELEKAWQEWNAQLQAPEWIRRDARTTGRGAATRAPATDRGVDVERRFRRMDRDGDGKLSRDEVGRQARPPQSSGSRKNQARGADAVRSCSRQPQGMESLRGTRRDQSAHVRRRSLSGRFPLHAGSRSTSVAVARPEVCVPGRPATMVRARG
jgi:MoaA/NifB/PqqE/SkfB family radical SAM enzyme